MSSVLDDALVQKENTPPSKTKRNMITYACPMCDKKFPFNFHLQRHIASNHRAAKRTPKPLCSDSVLSTPKRASSRQSGVGSECEFCGQRFNLALSLQQHMYTKHPNGPRRSDTIRALQTGVLHQCDLCGKWFTFSSQLRDHIETEHRVSPEKSGRPRSQPHSAKKSPAAEKNTPIIRQKMNRARVCKRCDKDFSSYQNLLRHMKTAHNVTADPDDVESEEDVQVLDNGNLSSAASLNQPGGEDEAQKTQLFSCKLCKKRFKLNFLLRRHMETAHPEGSSTPVNSDRAENKSDPVSSFRCDLCGEIFKLNFHLRRHIAKAHASAHFRLAAGIKVDVEPTPGKGKYPKCTHCGKTFKLNIQLRRHLKTEHNGVSQVVRGRVGRPPLKKKAASQTPSASVKRSRANEENGDEDSDDQGYVDNEEEDANYSPSADRKSSPRSSVPKERLRWICQYCKRAFAYNYYLQKHIATRHSEVPDSDRLVCKHCGMSFKMNILLRRHIMSQHPEFATPDTLPKPPPRQEYPCTVCGMMFDRNTHLRRHISIAHDGNQTPSCEPCGKTFYNYLAYMRHMSAVHKTLRSDPCHICGKRFTVNANLRRHIATVHEKLKFATCDICGKHFTQTHNLKVHMETHNRHLLRVIEESEEVDLPDPGSDVEMEHLRNGSLIRPEDIETVEAITLELPSSSETSSADENDQIEDQDHRGDNRENEEVLDDEDNDDEVRRPREDGRVEFHSRQSVRGGTVLGRTMMDDGLVHNHKNSYKKMVRNRRRPSDWTAGEAESGVVPSARRQHPVFMRKPIDLSQPVVADQADSLRATAAVYTTYMLA